MQRLAMRAQVRSGLRADAAVERSTGRMQARCRQPVSARRSRAQWLWRHAPKSRQRVVLEGVPEALVKGWVEMYYALIAHLAGAEEPWPRQCC